MRTIAPVLIVFALGVSGAMIGLSGFEDAWGADAPETSAAQEELEGAAADADPNEEPISGPVTFGEGNIVGLIANGLSTVTSFAGAVALLPVTLINIGFPAWFSIPIGMLGYFLAGVGLIQFATNREWI